MSTKFTIILTITLAASTIVKANLGGGVMTGGTTVQSTEGQKAKLLEKLEKCQGKTPKHLDAVNKISLETSQLILYGTQVVAGVNDSAIFKLANNQGFACIKIWNKLDKTYDLTNAAVVATYGEIRKACNFGESFVSSYTDQVDMR